MRALCIGSSVLETTCVINEKIEDGKKIRVENQTKCGGGHAGNIAYLLGKWGVDTYIASMLGADDAAAKIKKEYETLGIKTDYIETSFDRGTSEMLVFINETTKDKTVLELASNSYLKKYAFGIEPDVVVSDGNDFNATVAAFDKYSKVPSFLVVSRFANELIELSKYGSTLIINKGTAEQITNMKIDYNDSATLVNIYNKLKQKFSQSEIVLTLGERGCVYAMGGQVKIMPPVKVGIVDTNGAGDVFAGAFIYGMGRNFGLEKSLAYATIAASLSTTKLTSRNSIPSLTEVSTYYDSKFGAQNNPNNPASATSTTTGTSNATTSNGVTPNPGNTPNPNPGSVETAPKAPENVN